MANWYDRDPFMQQQQQYDPYMQQQPYDPYMQQQPYNDLQRPGVGYPSPVGSRSYVFPLAIAGVLLLLPVLIVGFHTSWTWSWPRDRRAKGGGR